MDAGIDRVLREFHTDQSDPDHHFNRMDAMKIEFGLADLHNGIFARYKTEDEAKEAYWEAVSEGCIANQEAIGEAGCPWKSEDDCRQAAMGFFCTVKITTDEQGHEIHEQV